MTCHRAAVTPYRTSSDEFRCPFGRDYRRPRHDGALAVRLPYRARTVRDLQKLDPVRINGGDHRLDLLRMP